APPPPGSSDSPFAHPPSTAHRSRVYVRTTRSAYPSSFSGVHEVKGPRMGKSIEYRGRGARVARSGENRRGAYSTYVSTGSGAATTPAGMDRARDRTSY